jgi:hypothetical protein
MVMQKGGCGDEPAFKQMTESTARWLLTLWQGEMMTNRVKANLEVRF